MSHRAFHRLSVMRSPRFPFSLERLEKAPFSSDYRMPECPISSTHTSSDWQYLPLLGLTGSLLILINEDTGFQDTVFAMSIHFVVQFLIFSSVKQVHHQVGDAFKTSATVSACLKKCKFGPLRSQL